MMKVLGISKQTIDSVIHFLEENHLVYDYYQHYKVNKNFYGPCKIHLTESVTDSNQTLLELDEKH